MVEWVRQLVGDWSAWDWEVNAMSREMARKDGGGGEVEGKRAGGQFGLAGGGRDGENQGRFVRK